MKLFSLFTFIFFFTQCCFAQGKNNVLELPNKGSKLLVGDIDISGNTITVEAKCFLKYDYEDLGYAADIVSKHGSGRDCNYLLRLQLAEITTTTGYHNTSQKCDYIKNTWYHVALVYDGKSLHLYRNGILQSKTAVTGNLVTNDLQTTIGDYAHGTAYETAEGYFDEIRIWNIARTESELRQYMNTSLPNPNIQKGLVAYYTFDDVKNKQGNSGYDGRLNGMAKTKTYYSNTAVELSSCGVIVEPPPPVIDFEYSIENCSFLKPRITKKENVEELTWMLDGQKIGNEKTYGVSLSGKENYKLQLIGRNKNKEVIKEKIITIKKPAAAITYVYDTVKHQVNLQSNASKNEKTRWFVNNVFTGSEAKLSHSLIRNDSMSVLMALVNKWGCSDTAKLVVYKPKPNVPVFDSSWLYVSNSSYSLDELFAGKAKEILNREKVVQKEMIVESDSIRIAIVDNATIDNDKVALFFNKKLIETDISLTAEPKSFVLYLDKTKTNELEIAALNLGDIPPNTALVTVYELGKKTAIVTQSTEQQTGVIRFYFKK